MQSFYRTIMNLVNDIVFAFLFALDGDLNRFELVEEFDLWDIFG